jgi:tRNA-binding protein
MSVPMDTIGFDQFLGVEIRTGTIVEAALNPKARVPAYVLRIDFGPAGLKNSSAQITTNYTAQELVGKQVVAVLNFEPKRVAGVKSEVLVLGAVSDDKGVVLLEPTSAVENGARIG